MPKTAPPRSPCAGLALVYPPIMEAAKKTLIGLVLLAVLGCGSETVTSPPTVASPTKPVPVETAAPPPGPEPLGPDDVTRFPPEHVFDRVTNFGALLVCAYPGAESFEANRLEGGE